MSQQFIGNDLDGNLFGLLLVVRGCYYNLSPAKEHNMSISDFILSPIDSWLSTDSTVIFVSGWVAVSGSCLGSAYLIWSYVGGLFASALHIGA
jgi:hypothetical protein